MRISLITHSYRPETGAAPNRLYEMCKGLKRNGVDISVVTGMPNYPTGHIFPGYQGKWRMTEEMDGIQVRRHWMYASNSKKILPRIWSMFSLAITLFGSQHYLRKRRNDFIIVQTPQLMIAFTAWLMAWATHTPLILNVSDLWPLTAKEMGAIRGDSPLYKAAERLERFLYTHSALCVGQSQQIVDYMGTHGAKQVYLFRNGVDPSRFLPNTADDNSEPLKLIYTGLIGYAQGLVEIAKHIDFAALGAELHIYGAGGEEHDLQDYLSEHPDKGIFFHGKVERDAVPALLAECHATLIPLRQSIYGAVPSKIYESMAAGLPILFSGNGEGADIVEQNQVGLVSSASDYDALAEHVRYLAQHREQLTFYRTHCLTCANQKFNRTKQTDELYEHLLTMIQ